MTKIELIHADNEFELVEKINESKQEYFATQPMQKIDGKWICFAYIKEESTEPRRFIRKNIYKEEPATKKQVDLIKKLNKGIIPAGISKGDANKLIKKLKNVR